MLINSSLYRLPVSKKIKNISPVTTFGNQKKPDNGVPYIFIAMPQKGKEWDDLNNVIQKEAAKQGVTARRIDDIIIETAKADGNQYISQEIPKWIDKSKIVIADVSDKNPNVMFEMGYAMAHNKKVIPIAKEGTNLPFDIKDINTIFYKDKKTDLKQKLHKILFSIFKNSKN